MGCRDGAGGCTNEIPRAVRTHPADLFEQCDVYERRGVCTNGLPAGWPQGCTCLPAISRARGAEPGTARPGIGKFDWQIRCCVHLKQALCVCLSVTLLCLQGLVGSFSFVSSCLFQFQWKIKAVNKCLHMTFSVFVAILCRVARMDRQTDRQVDRWIDNWLLTPSQPRKSYPGDSQTDRQTDR